ncbi:MAG TPA: MerR family transcriptional regulator, partial [Terriglobales bacterium]|nr:MerR family transcriptional regulator [Terriglobales bacterium]
FSALKPSKSGSQHRLYRRRDIDTLRQIKTLLYDERLTIEGARKRLKELQKKDVRQTELPLDQKNYRAILLRVRRELQSIHKLLSS